MKIPEWNTPFELNGRQKWYFSAVEALFIAKSANDDSELNAVFESHSLVLGCLKWWNRRIADSDSIELIRVSNMSGESSMSNSGHWSIYLRSDFNHTKTKWIIFMWAKSNGHKSIRLLQSDKNCHLLGTITPNQCLNIQCIHCIYW